MERLMVKGVPVRWKGQKVTIGIRNLAVRVVPMLAAGAALFAVMAAAPEPPPVGPHPKVVSPVRAGKDVFPDPKPAAAVFAAPKHTSAIRPAEEVFPDPKPKVVSR